uniref:Uncharacterized protein n=1 Tax=Anguilla anguilla TaxID=7936 RepID=A0A0E9TKA7_ANGAN
MSGCFDFLILKAPHLAFFSNCSYSINECSHRANS